MTNPRVAWQVDIDSLPGAAIDDDRLDALTERLVALAAASQGELAGPVLAPPSRLARSA